MVQQRKRERERERRKASWRFLTGFKMEMCLTRLSFQKNLTMTVINRVAIKNITIFSGVILSILLLIYLWKKMTS